eukprot:2283926-Amphidinium_carterae.1
MDSYGAKSKTFACRSRAGQVSITKTTYVDHERDSYQKMVPGFSKLRGLRIGRNRIEAVSGEPWKSLYYMDASGNSLRYIHPAWLQKSAQGSNLLGLDLAKNPDLRLQVAYLEPGRDCWNPGDEVFGLVMDPNGFLQGGDDTGYRCTSVCMLRELEQAVWTDATVNASVLCRCKAGWYGEGMNCSMCGLDEWCEEGSTFPRNCPGNSSTLNLTGRSSELDCECYAGSYRRLEPLRCEPCPRNTFRAIAGACLRCPHRELLLITDTSKTVKITISLPT